MSNLEKDIGEVLYTMTDEDIKRESLYYSFDKVKPLGGRFLRPIEKKKITENILHSADLAGYVIKLARNRGKIYGRFSAPEKEAMNFVNYLEEEFFSSISLLETSYRKGEMYFKAKFHPHENNLPSVYIF